ncbi:retinal pigment epithelial membrane protein [Polychytrium aggregatum]|uniref:retinal pigment epithelial membrane protein n=1 Tax=Polychytrium aggregatum TaxID=110093 RepID=UPI0022FED4A0|nr:retinal pigment epithelial membrane protein [Polychytrium aggregatum]KAI9190813.1 retinal pigment epithelial membrane protein [Polychytrium aggregatum]
MSGSDNKFLQGAYAPVADEIGPASMKPIEGTLPECMEGGMYIRVGPNPPPELLKKGMLYHWFDGDGMVHGVHFPRENDASYLNRYVQTNIYTVQKKVGYRPFPGLGGFSKPDPFSLTSALIKSYIGRQYLPTQQLATTANTALVFHDARVLSLMEAAPPYELTVPELETRGEYNYNGKFTEDLSTAQFSAHPKVCPETGEMFTFGYRLSALPPIHYSVIKPDGELLLLKKPIEGLRVTMMHDFAITRHYAIFMDLPYIGDVTRPMTFKGAVLEYDPTLPSRFAILDRYGDGEIRWFEDPDACYVYHTANAYEDGDEVVLQGCRYPDGPVLENNAKIEYENRRRRRAIVVEWRFNLATGAVQRRNLMDQDCDYAVDFPVVNPEYFTRKCRYIYSTGLASETQPGGVHKIDCDTSSVEASYWFGEGEQGGEMSFVPQGSGMAPDSGYLVGYVCNKEVLVSYLDIVDARSMKRVCRYLLPGRVPYGFHGLWLNEHQIEQHRQARESRGALGERNGAAEPQGLTTYQSALAWLARFWY